MSGIHFEASYDDAKLEAGLKRSNQKVQDWAKDAAHSGETVTDMFNRVKNTVAALASLEFGRRMITEVATVRGEWQKYDAVLTNTLGSHTEAVKSLDMISQYGAKTNFQVNELTDSFVKLANQGFKPTRDEMEALGDLAASKGKGFDQLAEAILDAEQLEFERLKEFGIRSSKEGDKVQFTFKGIKTEVDASSESIRKFILGLGQMDGVKGSTEAISKTIEGMTSNLEDAINQMFNSIGKDNEGAIEGAIQLSTELVQNYEKVIDALKIIVAAYGTYKAVLIATVAIQRSAVLATQIREYFEMGKALGFATANQIAFNRAAMANPYALIAGGITALIVVITTLQKKVKTTEDLISDLNSSMEQIGKQQGIDELVSKYTELSDKTNRTNDEQQQLNDTIKQLGTIFPDAIGQTDEYGKAVDIVTERLIANNAALRENLKITTGTEIEAANKKLEILIKDRSKLLEEVNTGKETKVEQIGSGNGWYGEVTYTLSGDDIEKKRTEINDLTGEISQLQETVTEGNKKLATLDAASTEQILAPYKALFDEAAKYSREQAQMVKEELSTLLGAGLGDGANEKIQSQIEEIDKRLGLPNVKKQLQDVDKLITVAQEKLVELRESSSDATSEQIENQEKEVKNLISKWETLAGKKYGDAEKELTTKEQLDKLNEQLLTANEEDRDAIAKKIVQLEYQLQLQQAIADASLNAARNQTLKTDFSWNNVRGRITGDDGKDLFIGKDQVKQIKGVSLEFDKLNKRLKETDTEQKKGLENTLQLSNEIMGVVNNITQKYAEQLGLNEEQAKVLNDGLQAMSGIADIASGNYLQGAAKLVDSAMSLFLKTPEKLSEHFENVQEQVEKILNSITIASESLSNLNVDASLRSIAIMKSMLGDLADDAQKLNEELDGKSYGHRDGDRAGATIIRDIVKQKADLDIEIQELSNRLLDGDLSDEQRAAIEAILKSYNELTMAMDATIESIIGTSIPDLQNSLANAFFEAEDAAIAWGDTVNDIIAQIVKNQLIAKLLTDPVNEAVNTLLNDYEDGELSEDDIKRFQATMKALYEDAAPAFDEAISSLEGLGIDFGSSDVTASGLSGQVQQSITEDTASELVGLWNRTALDTRSIRDYMLEGISHLVNIEANTYNTVVELQRAVVRLDRIVENTENSGSRI